MGDNGEAKKPELEKPPSIQMVVTSEPGKPFQVHFPFLNDKLATYGFLKMAEKTLDDHYARQKPKIIQPKPGAIMDFARKKR